MIIPLGDGLLCNERADKVIVSCKRHGDRMILACCLLLRPPCCVGTLEAMGPLRGSGPLVTFFQTCSV